MECRDSHFFPSELPVFFPLQGLAAHNSERLLPPFFSLYFSTKKGFNGIYSIPPPPPSWDGLPPSPVPRAKITSTFEVCPFSFFPFFFSCSKRGSFCPSMSPLPPPRNYFPRWRGVSPFSFLRDDRTFLRILSFFFFLPPRNDEECYEFAFLSQTLRPLPRDSCPGG